LAEERVCRWIGRRAVWENRPLIVPALLVDAPAARVAPTAGVGARGLWVRDQRYFYAVGGDLGRRDASLVDRGLRHHTREPALCARVSSRCAGPVVHLLHRRNSWAARHLEGTDVHLAMSGRRYSALIRTA